MGDSSSAHNYSVWCFNNPNNTMAQTDTLMVKQNEILVAAASVMLGTQLIALGNDIWEGFLSFIFAVKDIHVVLSNMNFLYFYIQVVGIPRMPL